VSGALAGFVLVFLGVMIASYQSYGGDVPAPVVSPYRTTGGVLFGTFAYSLVTVATCLAWLALGGPAAVLRVDDRALRGAAGRGVSGRGVGNPHGPLAMTRWR